MNEEVDGVIDSAKSIANQLDASILDSIYFKLIIALMALLVLLAIFKKIRRAQRMKKPVRLHPKLQKYGGNCGGGDAELLEMHRDQADKIIATSSTSSVTGYETVRQVEAVSVDGLGRTGDALLCLKITAAIRGANAVVNVRQAKDGSGKFSATGDAVVVKSIVDNADQTTDDMQ